MKHKSASIQPDLFEQEQPRAYGLLASAGCKTNIARARELMAAPMPGLDPPAAHNTDDPVAPPDHHPPCPCCGGRMIIVEVFARGGSPRGPPSSGAGNEMIRRMEAATSGPGSHRITS